MKTRRYAYYIFDWAGNAIKPNKGFKDFETAWDYIFGELTDELKLTDECYQEYEVIEQEV